MESGGLFILLEGNGRLKLQEVDVVIVWATENKMKICGTSSSRDILIDASNTDKMRNKRVCGTSYILMWAFENGEAQIQRM